MLVKRKVLEIPQDLWAEIDRTAKRDFGGNSTQAIFHLVRRGLEADQKGKKHVR